MGNERPMEYSRMLPRMRTNMNFGREKLPWSQELWNRIDETVHTECKRTKVARKFLRLYGPIDGGQTTIHSDTVAIDGQQSLNVDETATTPLVEIVADFKLTAQQVDREEELMTAVTLAGRAANLISQGADVLIFQGQEAVEQHPLFAQKKVRLLSGNAGTGLLNGLSGIQIVEVDPSSVEGDELRFGEKTFEAVAKAYSRLQSGAGLAQAHYGPYALVLNFVQYADSLAPLEKTLIMPADRITSLVEVLRRNRHAASLHRASCVHWREHYGLSGRNRRHDDFFARGS